MLRLTVETPLTARLDFFATSFPYILGSSPSAQARIEAAGVWERHAVLELDKSTTRFKLSAIGAALILVNGQNFQSTYLRNGDLIQIGASHLRVGFAPARQRSLLVREAGTWMLFILVLVIQTALVWLLH